MSKDLEQLENLILAGDSTNFKLALQLAKALGLKEIPLLKNLEQCAQHFERSHRPSSFKALLRALRRQKLTFYNQWYAVFPDCAAIFAPHITHLKLRSCKLIDIFPHYLERFTKVIHLKIADSLFFVNQAIPSIFSLPNVEILDVQAPLCNTIFNFPKLRYLIIRDIKNIDIPILSQLSNFPALRTVKLCCILGGYVGNGIYRDYLPFNYQPQDIVQQLQSAFPHLKIRLHTQKY